MAIRVAQIGTGNFGSLALNQLVSDARFDLTGVWVSSEAKVGRDAGELAGLGCPPVRRDDDLDAIIAEAPEALCIARWVTPGCPTRWPTFADSRHGHQRRRLRPGCCSIRGM